MQQTDVDRPIRCSSLTLMHKKHLKMALKEIKSEDVDLVDLA
jgi:hypothetical protein